MQLIETERLILRQWKDSDLPEFARINSDENVMEFFPFRLTPQKSNELATKFQKHFDVHGFSILAVEVKNGAPFIGFIGLIVQTYKAHFTPCVEIAWRIAHEHWGQGYATEGAKAAMKYGFEEIGLKEIVSLTTEQNKRSRRIMEKLGMSRNASEDFDHPSDLMPEGHPLKRHMLYRKKS